VVRRRPGFGGSIGAVVAFCLSLTPSLLPRHWALQGVLSGITMATGYGAGATAGAVARTIWPRLPAAGRRCWLALAGAAGPLAVTFLWLGESWQQEVRRLVGQDPAVAGHPVLVGLVAAGVVTLLLAGARGLRLGTRRLAATFGRFSPRPVASVAAVGVVAALSFGVGQQVVFTGFVDIADRVAAAANRDTPPGLARPVSPYVSGSPGSLVPWDTLGAYGQAFTAGAVPRRELVDFPGGSGGVEPPIRVYVGRDSAPDLAAQARLAVRELARTGGFEREVLVVIATTGTGWVNPAVAESVELMYGGDSALVAMQYSYLPSWISFLADRSTAAEAAAALVGAVQTELATVPAAERPVLAVYGESLGARGLEVTFGDLAGLLAGTDAALLAGPPYSNPVWQEVVEQRDPGSPVWRPDRQAGAVRFGQRPADLAGPLPPRVVYLQNASDPVVWWSPELLWREPEWLAGARGPDVSGAVRWFPVVTFWQVTVDLVASTKVPSGHGHSYQGSVADAWAALIPPPGWTDAATDQLRWHGTGGRCDP
jgi:uncharacterized membrane protein